jgi:hypothetical protein
MALTLGKVIPDEHDAALGGCEIVGVGFVSGGARALLPVQRSRQVGLRQPGHADVITAPHGLFGGDQ